MTLDASRPGGDPENGIYLGTACDLAYLPSAEGTTAFREKLGLDARLISAENTQVYVGQNASSIVAAFRGSENPASLDGLRDWLLTNANNFLTLPEGQMGTDFVAAGVGARFHRGFLSALQHIWEPFYVAVSTAHQEAARPVWITGHSLGGAIALLAAWRLERQFIPVHQIVTFGAPMIGNEAAARAFEETFRDRIFRYVNAGDFVPRLPSFSLTSNPYTHCQREMLLKGAAALASGVASGVAGETGRAAIEVMNQMAGKTTQAVMDISLMDELWGHVMSSIDEHMVPYYLKRLRGGSSDQG
jgi:hypothetical protein